MLTPPYHFSIVACPAPTALESRNSEILYRGSIPTTRNFSHVNRLRLKTVLYLSKKGPDVIVKEWAARRKVDLQWIKVPSELSEEKLGIGRDEVGQALKVVLDPAAYPLYIADNTGRSHTITVVACLRKLQGWHIDSIISEISRFEPEYEDYTFVPFVNSYLANQDTPFVLPPTPHPAWLWPAGPSTAPSPPPSAIPSAGLSRTVTITRDRSTSKTVPKEKEAQPNGLLPFAHPLQARKHPTMRITFPALPPGSASVSPLSPSQPNLSRTPTRTEKSPFGGENRPTIATTLVNAATSIITSSGISGIVPSDPTVGTGEVPPPTASASSATSAEPSLPHSRIASSASNFSPRTISEVWAGESMSSKFTQDKPAPPRTPMETPAVDLGTERFEDTNGVSGSSEQTTASPPVDNDGPAVPTLGSDSEAEDEDEDEEYDDDDDEEDEDEDEVNPPSQYISALDLAGF